MDPVRKIGYTASDFLKIKKYAVQSKHLPVFGSEFDDRTATITFDKNKSK